MKQLPNLTPKEENFLCNLLEIIKKNAKKTDIGNFKFKAPLIFGNYEFDYLKEIVENITEK